MRFSTMLCSLTFLFYLTRKAQTVGEMVAIGLPSRQLRKQGFDTFWRPDEYARLQKTPML